MQEKILSCGQLLGLLSLAKVDLDKLSHGSAVRSGTITSVVWQYQSHSSPCSHSLPLTQISKNNCLCSLNDLFWFEDKSSQNKQKECSRSHARLPTARPQDQSLQEGVRDCPSPAGLGQPREQICTHMTCVCYCIPLTCALSGSCTSNLDEASHEGRAGNPTAIWSIFIIGLIVMAQSSLDFLWN